MPRLFFAVDTPQALKQRLAILQDEIEEKLQSLDPLPNFKPEKLQNSHCTIRFLGNVEQYRIAPMIAVIQSTLDRAALPSFDASLTHCGTFASRGKTRVIWIGIKPEKSFQSLQSVVDAGLCSVGIEPDEEQTFHPHLTLFRFREPYRLPLDFAFPSPEDTSPTFSVRELILFESKTLPAGPVHQVLARFQIA